MRSRQGEGGPDLALHRPPSRFREAALPALEAEPADRLGRSSLWMWSYESESRGLNTACGNSPACPLRFRCAGPLLSI